MLLIEFVASCCRHPGKAAILSRRDEFWGLPAVAREAGEGGRVSCVEHSVHLTRLLDASRKLLTGRPLLLSTLVAILAISAIFTASVAAWMSYDLTAGLPKRDAINGLADMAQSGS